jgi:predicted transposase YbfD/YdcC
MNAMIPAPASLAEALAQVDLAGHVVLGDALQTQRDVGEQIVAAGGDYLLPVKENQPALLADLEAAFSPSGSGSAADGQQAPGAGVAGRGLGAARAPRLLRLNREYWGIENRLHWVRDVTLGEDRSQIRSGAAPQVCAALRSLGIALLRRSGASNIAGALRTFSGRPRAAVALVLSGLTG